MPKTSECFWRIRHDQLSRRVKASAKNQEPGSLSEKHPGIGVLPRVAIVGHGQDSPL